MHQYMPLSYLPYDTISLLINTKYQLNEYCSFQTHKISTIHLLIVVDVLGMIIIHTTS